MEATTFGSPEVQRLCVAARLAALEESIGCVREQLWGSVARGMTGQHEELESPGSQLSEIVQEWGKLLGKFPGLSFGPMTIGRRI